MHILIDTISPPLPFKNIHTISLIIITINNIYKFTPDRYVLKYIPSVMNIVSQFYIIHWFSILYHIKNQLNFKRGTRHALNFSPTHNIKHYDFFYSIMDYQNTECDMALNWRVVDNLQKNVRYSESIPGAVNATIGYPDHIGRGWFLLFSIRFYQHLPEYSSLDGLNSLWLMPYCLHRSIFSHFTHGVNTHS